MAIVEAYQCARCKKIWNIDKKTDYINHLRAHVSRDRFKVLEKEIIKYSDDFHNKMKNLKGYIDFINIVQNSSPLMFYKQFNITLREYSSIEFVKKIEFYRGKKISEIFTEKTTWKRKNTHFYRGEYAPFEICFSGGDLFLPSQFWRMIDNGITIDLEGEESAHTISCTIAEDGCGKKLYESLQTMEKLKK